MKRFFTVCGAACFAGMYVCSLLGEVMTLSAVFISAGAVVVILSICGILASVRKKSVWKTFAVAAAALALSVSLWGIAEIDFRRSTDVLAESTKELCIRFTDSGTFLDSGSVAYTAVSADGSFSHSILIYSFSGIDCDAYDYAYCTAVFYDSDNEFASYNRARGVVGSCYIDNVRVVKTLDRPVDYYISCMRDSVESAANAVTGERSDILKALLLGDKSGLSDADRDSVRKAGLSHVVAVSGFHVGMLSMLIVWLVGFIPFKSVRAVVYVLSLFLFLSLCSFTPSAVRAVIMAVMSFGVRSFSYKPDPLNGLGFAVFLMLVINPLTVNDVGFLLSVSATVGILVLYPVMRRSFRTFLFDKFAYLPGRIVGTLCDITCLSVSCLLFTYPFSVLYFGTANLTGIFSYIVCLPAVYLTFFAGIFAVMLYFIPFCLEIASAAGSVAAFGGNMFLKLTEFFNIRSVEIDPLYLLISILAGFVVFLLLNAGVKKSNNRRKNKKKIFAPVSVTVLLIVFSVIVQSFLFKPAVIYTGDGVTAAYINVGQGMGSVIIDSGSAVIIDCGGNSKAGDQMADYLDKNGITDIEFVVLSHLHEDHTSGFSYLCDSFDIDEVIIPWTDGDAAVYDEVMAAADKEGATVTVIRKDESRQFNDTELTFLTGHFLESTSDQNENSIVCRADVGDVSFMFTGDITSKAEKRLIDVYPSQILSVTVLGVPHHGSKYSSCVEFVSVVSPEVSVISVGKNTYGHPSDDVVSRLLAYGRVYRTDVSGTIEIYTDGSQWEVLTEQ